MQSSIPCIPPAAWPRRKPFRGKKLRNQFDWWSALGSGWSSDRSRILSRSGAKGNQEQHRSPEEVIRRRVGLARRCSGGSGRPYGSLAARAGQNQWLLTGHPHLATVKGRMLFFWDYNTFCSSARRKSSLLGEVLLPFILLPPDRASTPSASLCVRGGSESSPW